MTDSPKLTPVWLDLDSPVPFILWTDLSDMEWAEPAFHDTVGRAVQANPQRTRVRSGLDALDSVPDIAPALGIFHATPDGSTVLSESLAARNDTVVIREAALINAVLSSPRPREERVRLLRKVMGALARPRITDDPSDERRLVVKFYGWNVQHLDLIAEAFPAMRWVFVYGEPRAMLAAVWPRRATWLGFLADPEDAARIVGLSPGEMPRVAPHDFYGQALAVSGEAALAALDEKGRLIHESTLPDAIDTCVLPLMGLAPDGSRYTPPPHDDDDEDDNKLPDAVPEAAERWLADVVSRLQSAEASCGRILEPCDEGQPKA